MLTFEQFRDRLAAVLEIGSESLAAEVSFIEDLAFDSLRMLTLATLFEELDVDMPAELAWEIRTVGDAYAYYVGQRESSAASSR